MEKFKGFKKTLLQISIVLGAISAPATAVAQDVTPLSDKEFDDKYSDYRVVYQDSSIITAPTTHEVVKENLSPYQVVTNKFGKNWFAFATAGGHTFQGDYSNWDKFSGTLSWDWSVGIGKWFTPGIGLKIEFIRSDSRGYTANMTGGYGYGDIMWYPDKNDPDAEPYRKMKTRWWDISGSVILNLSRLFLGYEGFNSPRLMNQFMFAAGIGGVHHLGYGHRYGSDNEWSGHLELQYSRFFTKSKRWSLDAKIRGIFYQTNFDLEYGQANHAANKWDCNVGVDLGFTFYLDSKRNRGWKTAVTHTHTRDYTVQQYREVRVKEEQSPMTGFSEITFYVFYPNNYSGRNDAPLVASDVNAIEYLTGGIYTQKRYTDNAQVAVNILNNKSLASIPTIDLPTEPADTEFAIDFIPRGYEMGEGPISLSDNPDSIAAFRQKAGFYYAPIYGDKHLWHYRIDNATLDQKLVSEKNYFETQTFGLNANKGISTIRANFDAPGNEYLVSLADMYAALNTNRGHIADHTDSVTVNNIRHIINSGVITAIHVEGLATSQDNYTGPNSKEVGIMRNTALSENRANTVLAWLKSFDCFRDIDSKTYRVSSFNNSVYGIGVVDDPSTRGLKAKLNRCVKVHIQYMIPPRR
ncbi:MAG: hypothetical protein K2L91_06685 [Duncaniella sp.]|nr:hypothetical protein [Duncaniella sp.]